MLIIHEQVLQKDEPNDRSKNLTLKTSRKSRRSEPAKALKTDDHSPDKSQSAEDLASLTKSSRECGKIKVTLGKSDA